MSVGNSTHFTYCDPKQHLDLRQGDVLEKKGKLVQLLEEVHPHYARPDYTHLMVISQTCDLVRRGNSQATNSRYITLVAIRPLETVLERELANWQKSDFEVVGRISGMNTKNRMYSFIESLLNNNKSDFFYLHPDTQFGFGVPSCSFLRLPVSIRASEHYQKCLDARILSLDDTFQAKLGHHLGHLYSRVGTEDWVPKFKNESDFKKLINNHLDGLCKWVDDEKLRAVAKDVRDKSTAFDTYESAQQYYESYDFKPKAYRVAERVVEVLVKDGFELSDEKKTQLTILLANDAQMKSAMK